LPKSHSNGIVVELKVSSTCRAKEKSTNMQLVSYCTSVDLVNNYSIQWLEQIQHATGILSITKFNF
jgi:hypothetical protein